MYKWGGNSVERIPPPRNAWSTRTYRVQYIFKYHAIYRFWPDQWQRITLKKKHSRIQIFTKIKPIRPCHTLNLFPLVSSTSVHNFLRYRAIYHFWPYLSMVKNHFNSSSWIRIRIFNKIESVLPCHTPNLPTKFHPDPCTTFWDILHTNKQRQTDRQTDMKT